MRSPSRAIGCSRRRLYQFTAIDDCTRIRVLKIYDRCNQATAIQFIDEVRQRLPFRVLVIQTDNGAEFQSRFHWHLESLDVCHVYIRPRMPHLNGKVERSPRTSGSWLSRGSECHRRDGKLHGGGGGQGRNRTTESRHRCPRRP